ncbi:hypothetical protein EAOG_02856 [Escherichia coli R527]|nr:hypothetical protein EAOG_02856 [Escherichia coli R527]
MCDEVLTSYQYMQIFTIVKCFFTNNDFYILAEITAHKVSTSLSD